MSQWTPVFETGTYSGFRHEGFSPTTFKRTRLTFVFFFFNRLSSAGFGFGLDRERLTVPLAVFPNRSAFVFSFFIISAP